MTTTTRFRTLHGLIALGLATVALGVGAESDPEELTSIPFERLVHAEVLTASRLATQISDSPAAVSIVTAEDIQVLGYKTLADVINGMRGLYTTSDRRYDYLGGRGFGNPGDYAGRIMLLIDGYAAQDNVYGQVYIDNSGLLDMALIDRVEYVPGTGSVTYGNGAFLGIINVITKNGRDFQSVQLGSEVASFGTTQRRLTLGRQLDNGANLLLSASDLRSAGQDLYFPYFDAMGSNQGWAVQQDGEYNRRYLAKLQYEGLTVLAGQSHRLKRSPLPKKQNAFNRLYEFNDTSTFLSTRWEFDAPAQFKGSTHIYLGNYQDRTLREYGAVDPHDQYLRNQVNGRWMGWDQKFVTNRWKHQQVVLGAEYRHDVQQEIGGVGLTADGVVNNTAQGAYAYNARTLSLYVADEIQLGRGLSTNLGLRWDRPMANDCSRADCVAYAYQPHLSPRVALTYVQDAQTTYKASYSEAYRLPTPNELPSDSWDLYRPEQVAATELVVTHDFSGATRWTGSLYSYRLKDIHYLASGTGADVYDGSSATRGLEMQIDHRWDNGVQWRTSAAWQDAKDPEGQTLVNSPPLIAKSQWRFPANAWGWRWGVEAQYMGPRYTRPVRDDSGAVTRGGRGLDGFFLAHLTATNTRLARGLSVGVGVKNLFNQSYEAVSPKVYDTGTAVLDSLPMNGRSLWLQLTLDVGL
ncbi:MAG: TonB-dependent receptor [Rhodoferax sp.]|nr:TonB-dependent receptor [Rhodoferax sp.]